MSEEPERPDAGLKGATAAAPIDHAPMAVRGRWLRRWGLAGLGVAAVAVASGCVASVADDVLTVTGGGYSESIAVRLKPGDPNTVEVDFGADGNVEYAFSRDTFTQIVVNGGGGDDVLVIDQSNGAFTDTETTTLNGGDGNDALTGGSGAERLDGGPGNDTLDGNQADDALIGGAGDDTLRWDPGDADDTLDGGADADRLALNGSATNEIFGFSAASGHVRLTRNIGNVLLDLDDVETVDLGVLGGADQVLPGSVAGTDLATINVNAAGPGGTDDSQIDEVVVPPGLTIGNDGTAATIDGLGARVRLLNGSAADRVHVVGTAGSDVQALVGSASADAFSVTATGTDVAVVGATPVVHVLLTGVELLDVDLGLGNDTFSALGNLAALVVLDVDGGAGTDTIAGGNGADVLAGGADADFLDGNQGNDLVTGDGADDIVQWDPGDGNDTIDGGTGSDRMQLNGSNTNEIFAFSAVGDHVRLTRNIGNIALDLDGIDSFDLNALGGSDAVQIDNLAGTDLTTVTTNLAASGGAADALADQVTVNGTAGDDAVAVTAVGAVVQAAGLAPLVRVTGADPTLDRLTVNGLAGTDTITGSPAAAALILLDLVP